MLELLRGIYADAAENKAELKTEIATLGKDLRSEMHSPCAEVASDFLTTRKEFGDQIVGLRRAVVEYHSAVIGQAFSSAYWKHACAASKCI